MTAFERHKRFLEENREVLTKADIVKRSKEYKNAMHYFRMMKIRGNIKDEPCIENGFSVTKTEKRKENERLYESNIR